MSGLYVKHYPEYNHDFQIEKWYFLTKINLPMFWFQLKNMCKKELFCTIWYWNNSLAIQYLSTLVNLLITDDGYIHISVKDSHSNISGDRGGGPPPPCKVFYEGWRERFIPNLWHIPTLWCIGGRYKGGIHSMLLVWLQQLFKY